MTVTSTPSHLLRASQVVHDLTVVLELRPEQPGRALAVDPQPQERAEPVGRGGEGRAHLAVRRLRRVRPAQSAALVSVSLRGGSETS